ncbi:MAG: Ig-like domain-containing protein [Bacteroidales bacterium]|nr:Ig-like domain-containing protein [Bacteroidales bacterium]
MKNRILTFVLLLSGLFLLGGCYDSIEQRISLLKERVSELEDRANKLNESINNLSGLITALEKNDHIVSISDWSSGSKKGYRISFTSGSSLIINSGTNGVVPIVGVQFNEQYGAYYWTIQMGPDGSPTWMTNSYGQRVRASGTVPQLKIEDGIWWYSFDGGKTWNKTGWGAAQGENGTSVFSSIDTSDPYFVIFTLVDKSVIKLPTQKGIDDITNSCGLANEIIEMYMSRLLHTDSSRFVKNVVAIENENQTTGYRITFDDDSDITIFNGRNDRDSVWIGIQTYTDGKRYFVYRAHAGDYVDWMRYQGQMICADIEDVTPHIGITDSLGVLYFTVAYGEGEPELMLNAEGNPVQATGTVVLDFFTDIDLSNPNTVVLIMEDGTRIALPRTRIYTPSLTLLAADIDVAPGLEYPNQLVAILTDTLTSRTVCPDFDAFCELTGSHLEAVATDGGLVNTLRVASFVGRQISEGVAYTAHVTIPFTTASRADWDVTHKTRIAVFYSWGTSSIMKAAEFDQIILVDEVRLDETEITINKGETRSLLATVLPEDASDKTVTWSSSNDRIVRVSANGEITAVAEGTCTITATAGEKSASCQVTVVIPSSGVVLNKTKLNLWIHETEKLTATVLPIDVTDKTVTWSSDNEAVATVSQDGTVTAVGAGTCNITAANGGKSANCEVTVKIPVESVSLDKKEITMYVDSTVTLVATVLPENATDKTVTWLSGDTSVATVTQDGVVKAVGAGMCLIRASSGGKSATCLVTVKVPVSGITLDKDVLEMIVMQTTSLTATVLPANADDKTVTWSSSDPMVARVTPQGIITAVAPGTCIITATASGYSASCQVTVTMPVSSVTLDKEAITIYIGESTKLTATVLPENATDKTVTWTSSNELVADLSGDGTIHALSAGTCTITATAGGKSASCQVTVLTPVSRVTVAPASCQVFIDSTVTLVATVFPADAHDKTVTWSSSDETIATVTQGGVVSTHALGNCTITASAGGKSATCQVTVIPRVVITGITLEPKELEVYVGEVHNLNATITPEDATDKTIVWTTSDDAVVTVNAQGVVTPTGEGSGYVVASTVNGLTDTAYFTVLKAPVFPDAAFRTYVYDNFDTNHDGVLSRSEAKVVTTIQANGLGIQSLEGIEYFDALNALYCYNNQITSLTLTPTITYVVCFGNRIAKMDLTSATGLTYLECSDNRLDSLDVSSNPALQRLICDGNQMKSLDISNNPALISLMCQNNLLTSLDLSHAQNLQTLQCNNNRLATLNISRNRQMTNLNCLENPMTTLYMAIGQTVSKLRKPSDTTIEYIEVPDDPEPDPNPDPNPDLPDPDDPNT